MTNKDRKEMKGEIELIAKKQLDIVSKFICGCSGQKNNIVKIIEGLKCYVDSAPFMYGITILTKIKQFDYENKILIFRNPQPHLSQTEQKIAKEFANNGYKIEYPKK